MAFAEPLRFLLHNLNVSRTLSAHHTKELTIAYILGIPSIAEAFLHELLLDTNNVRPNGECLLRMRGGKRSYGWKFFSRSLWRVICP